MGARSCFYPFSLGRSNLMELIDLLLVLIALLTLINISAKVTNVVKLLQGNLKAQNNMVKQLHELRQELQDQRTDANPL